MMMVAPSYGQSSHGLAIRIMHSPYTIHFAACNRDFSLVIPRLRCQATHNRLKSETKCNLAKSPGILHQCFFEQRSEEKRLLFVQKIIKIAIFAIYVLADLDNVASAQTWNC